MRQIYENAEEVVIFVGDGLRHRILKTDRSRPPVPSGSLYLEDGQVLADLLSRCNSSRPTKALEFEAVLNVDAILRLLANPLTTAQLLDSLMALDEIIRRHLFEHLRNFLISPWWERIWVVQEVTVNRKVTLRYGAMSAPWDLLELAATVISELKLEPSRAQTELESENWKVLLLLENQVASIRRIRTNWQSKGVTARDYLLHEMLMSNDQGVRAANIRRIKANRGSEEVANLDALLQTILDSDDMVTRAESIAQVRKNWSSMQYNRLLQALSIGHERNQAANFRKVLDNDDVDLLPQAVNLDSLLDEIMNRSNLESRTASVRRIRDGWRSEAAKSLNQVLQEFSSRRASDDRDKVFGLLSLASPGHDVVPDYTLDVSETFRNTVLCLIKASGSLDVWTGDQRRKNNKGLPSWVPDWSATFNRSDSRRLETLDFYNASNDWKLIIDTSEEDYWVSIRTSMEELRDSLGQIEASLPASLIKPIRNCCERLKLEATHPDTEKLCDLILSVAYELDQLLLQHALVSRDGSHRPVSEIEYTKLFNRTHGGPLNPRIPATRCASYLQRNPPRQTIYSPSTGRTAFMMEASRVDTVARVGSPLWSWTDLETALRTLLAWFHLYIDHPLVTVQEWHDITSEEQIPIMLGRSLKFARTIVGGGLIHSMSDATTHQHELNHDFYTVLNENDLNTLKDWLYKLSQDSDEVIGRVQRGQWKLQNLDQTDTLESHLIPFQRSLQHATEGRAFFTTDKGFTGLGPASTEPGDIINMLPSGKTHFILRRADAKNAEDRFEFAQHGIQTMELIGDCYWSKWEKETREDLEVEQPRGSLPYELLAPFFEFGDPSRQTIALV